MQLYTTFFGFLQCAKEFLQCAKGTLFGEAPFNGPFSMNCTPLVCYPFSVSIISILYTASQKAGLLYTSHRKVHWSENFSCHDQSTGVNHCVYIPRYFGSLLPQFHLQHSPAPAPAWNYDHQVVCQILGEDRDYRPLETQFRTRICSDSGTDDTAKSSY